MLYPFIKERFFVVQSSQAQVWGTPPPIPNPEENKKLFGIELAKCSKPFDAACKVFEEVKIALWISQNWLSDPVVVASKDLYGETVKLSSPILDKERLALRVLQEADDLPEGKDRIAALKLYSEIAGYTGKVNIDASTKNYTHNEMKIKLVKASDKLEKEIEHTQVQENNTEEFATPIKLKLVKAS